MAEMIAHPGLRVGFEPVDAWRFLSPGPKPTVTWNLVTFDRINARRYHANMIRSFADKEAEKLFERQTSRRLPTEILRAARRKLEILDAAERLEDLLIPPSNRLEKLSGDRSGQHSIRINKQWRICFRWHESAAHDVEIVDYH